MEEKICFVISPIGEEGDEIRKHADYVLNELIKPAAADLCSVERGDKARVLGKITNTIIGLINSADLVVADLSYQNPNVFYELAIRHFIGKPVILIKSKMTKLPFNIADQATLDFTLGSAGEVIQVLRSKINDSLSNKDKFLAEDPISIAKRAGYLQNGSKSKIDDGQNRIVKMPAASHNSTKIPIDLAAYESENSFVLDVEKTGTYFSTFINEYYTVNAPLQYELTNNKRLRSHIERLKNIQPHYYYPIFADEHTDIARIWKSKVLKFFNKLIMEKEFNTKNGRYLKSKYKFYVPEENVSTKNFNKTLSYPWSLFIGHRANNETSALIYLYHKSFFDKETLSPLKIIGINGQVCPALMTDIVADNDKFREIQGIDAFIDYLKS